ncbi:MAG: hypothetical protein H0W50_06845 [Parachlamydiaceae bacterium]|nr:hypothetical protein [Parachlamydiaceae bacterium]
MSINIQIGANRELPSLASSTSPSKQSWANGEVTKVATKINELSTSLPQINITANGKNDFTSESSGASPVSPLVNVKVANTDKPLTSEKADWTQTAKRIAVVALPIIGVLAFIGLSIGVGVATGGVGMIIPLLAGLILLSTFAASAAITHYNENLWDNSLSSNPTKDSKIDKKDEDKEDVTDNKVTRSDVKSENESQLSKEEKQNVSTDDPKKSGILNQGISKLKSFINPKDDDKIDDRF